MRQKNQTIITKSLIVVMVFLAGIVFAFSNSYADDIVDEIGIGVPISCTLSGTGNNSHTATIPNGIYSGTYSADGVDYTDGIGTTTLTAMCNDNEGFAIYAAGYTGDEIGGTNSINLVGTSASGNSVIVTGTNTGPVGGVDTSNWAMKLSTVSNPIPTYPIIIAGSTADTSKVQGDPDYSTFQAVPSSYTKVAYRTSGTDIGQNGVGSTLTTTYAAYISKTQPADTYSGKVIYTLVHPANEEPVQPQPATAGCINYFANASTTEGTMGCQSVTDGNTVTLLASNFSREGYGFAGWSDAYDYKTNPNAHFYGPQEDITVPVGTTANGLSLYAVWVKSAGTMQTDASSVCNSLTAATYDDENDDDESTWSIIADLSSVSALTDNRDNQTYAIAKLTDGNCWMIENLRLADTHKEGNTTAPTTLTIANTNNPINDGITVTLKHNYSDANTYTNLSSNSDVAYDADTAPDGWCIADSAACDDQSRLRTDNTANRATNPIDSTGNMYSYGNYYNWYSATAGNGTYGKSSGDTEGDLCPAGWHLPTGHSSSDLKSGEFGLLSNSLGGYKNANNVAQLMDDFTVPTYIIIEQRFRHFPTNLLYSGFLDSGTFRYRGSVGSYWTATARNNNSAFYLTLDLIGFTPGTCYSYNKYRGRAIRCLKSSI